MEAKESPYAIAKEVLETWSLQAEMQVEEMDTYERKSGL